VINNPGPQLGNYRLLQKLGGGGFADVYLGEHIQLRKRAAVKIFKSSVTPHETPDFLREGRVLASLEHPNIIPVFDCGVEKHTPFLIMTYASGGSLRDRIPRGICPPLQDIVSYVSQTANALYYAHEHGVIHRDIKPENLLLGGQDVVLVSDFGIALLANATFSRTQSVMGTWAYMAPEQFAGKPCFASDQYALGVVIYEWICGKRPFQGLQEVLPFQHQQVEPPPFRDHNVMVPPAIERVVMKALAKRPQERFATILDFSNALRQAMLSSTDALEFSVLPQVTTPSLRLRAVTLLRDTKAVSTPPALLTFSPYAKTFVSTKHSPYMKLALLTLMVFVIAISSFLAYAKITNSSSASLSKSLVAGKAAINQLPTQPDAPPLFKNYDTAASHSMMFGFDAAHTHFNPYEKQITPANVFALQQYWVGTTYGGLDSSPVVADGFVYIASQNGMFYAFPARCSAVCNPAWTASLDNLSNSSPAVADNMVYIASTSGKLYAFSAYGCKNPTCRPLWTGDTGGKIYGSPTVAEGFVYIGSQNGMFYAFPARCSDPCPPSWSVNLSGPVYATATVSNHFVYIGDRNGMFYSFPTQCTTPCPPQWTTAFGGSDFGSAAVSNGRVYIGSSTGSSFSAFNASCPTGCSALWTHKTGRIYSSPAVAHGVVYIGSDDGTLYAFRASCLSSPCTPIWTFHVQKRISYSSPMVANGVVYIGSEDGSIYALNAACNNPCTPIWTAPLGMNVHSSPTVADGVLYVGATTNNGGGYLYAFRLPPG
jgi:serine/threonine protein kinase